MKQAKLNYNVALGPHGVLCLEKGAHLDVVALEGQKLDNSTPVPVGYMLLRVSGTHFLVMLPATAVTILPA